MEVTKSLRSLMLKSVQTIFFWNFPFLGMEVDFFSEKSEKTSFSCFRNVSAKVLFIKNPKPTIKQTKPPHQYKTNPPSTTHKNPPFKWQWIKHQQHQQLKYLTCPSVIILILLLRQMVNFWQVCCAEPYTQDVCLRESAVWGYISGKFIWQHKTGCRSKQGRKQIGCAASGPTETPPSLVYSQY